VTDVPGNREWIEPGVNGWLPQPGDTSALASDMLQALHNSSRWAQIGQINRSIVRERANWNKNFQVLLDTYERLATVRKQG